MEYKNILFFIFILLTIEIKSNQIHLLNDINQICILEIDTHLDYYFYTSVKDVKVDEHISYFVSEEIKEFQISYTFLDKDNYEELRDSDLNNYYFNEKLEYCDGINYFKTIFKTDDNRKGLLLKMKI